MAPIGAPFLIGSGIGPARTASSANTGTVGTEAFYPVPAANAGFGDLATLNPCSPTTVASLDARAATELDTCRPYLTSTPYSPTGCVYASATAASHTEVNIDIDFADQLSSIDTAGFMVTRVGQPRTSTLQ